MENLFHDLISAMNRQQGQTSAPSTNSPFQPPSVPAPLPVEEDLDDDDDDIVTRPTAAGSESDERMIHPHFFHRFVSMLFTLGLTWKNPLRRSR